MPSNPNRQIAGLVLAALVGWAAGYGVHRTLPANDVDWVEGMYRGKRAVAARSNGPRVVLLGGSGTHYGVSAGALSQRLGVSAINLGLHSQLGLAALMAVYPDAARAGDVMVLMPEHHLFSDSEVFGPLSTPFLVRTDQPLAGAEDVGESLDRLRQAGTPGFRNTARGFLLKVFHYKGATLYSPDVDAYGDPPRLPKDSGKPFATPKAGQVTQAALARLAAYRAELQARGARLVVALPMCYRPEADAERIGAVVREEVRAVAAVVPVLTNDSFELSHDRSLFTDNNYHLTRNGSDLRTAELAKQLAPYLTGPISSARSSP